MVDHHRAGRYIEEREENPCADENHERVEGNLTQHEGPVVRKDFVKKASPTLSDTEAIIELIKSLTYRPEGTLCLLFRFFSH